MEMFILIFGSLLISLILLRCIIPSSDFNTSATSKEQLEKLETKINNQNAIIVLDFLQSQVGLNKKFTTCDISTGLNIKASAAVGALTALAYRDLIERTPEEVDGKMVKYMQLTIKGFNYYIFKGE